MSYAYLLNVEPSNLVFLKTYNTEFGEMFIHLQIKMVDHGGQRYLTLLIYK